MRTYCTLGIEGDALLVAEEESAGAPHAERGTLLPVEELGAGAGRGEAALHEESGGPAREIGAPRAVSAFEKAARGRRLVDQALLLDGREGALEEDIGGLEPGFFPEPGGSLARIEEGQEGGLSPLRAELLDGDVGGKELGKALDRVEDGKDRHTAPLVLGDDGELGIGAGEPELPLGQEGEVKAAGLEARGEGGLPAIVLDPAATGPSAEGLADIGREEFHLAEPVLAGQEGKEGGEEAAAQELYLFSPRHLLEEHEEFGVFGLEPAQDRARIVKDGEKVGKTIEDGEKGPPADLICLFKQRGLGAFGKVIVGADDDRTFLH